MIYSETHLSPIEPNVNIRPEEAEPRRCEGTFSFFGDRDLASNVAGLIEDAINSFAGNWVNDGNPNGITVSMSHSTNKVDTQYRLLVKVKFMEDLC